MKRIFANLGWLLGGRGVNAVLSLVYLGLATRSLGIEDFGRFTLIVVMAQMLAGLLSFSTWQGVVRWGAELGRAGEATGFAVALDLASLCAGLPVVAAAAWLAPLWLPLEPDLRGAALGMGACALLALRSTPVGVLRLYDRYGLAASAEAALPLVRALGAGMAALFWPTITGFVVAWALAELACAAAHWLLALRVQPLRRADISLSALPARHGDAWRFVWSTNLSRSLAVTSRQAVQLLVGAIGGAAIAAGYRLAAQLGTALVQLGEAVSRAIYPELVRAGDEAGALAGRMAAIAATAGLLATGIAVLFGREALVWLAGADFAMAATALTILVAGGACELLAASWDARLVAQGRAATVLVLRGVPLVFAMASLPLVIPALGLSGAAASMALASAVTAGLLVYVAGWRAAMR